MNDLSPFSPQLESRLSWSPDRQAVQNAVRQRHLLTTVHLQHVNGVPCLNWVKTFRFISHKLMSVRQRASSPSALRVTFKSAPGSIESPSHLSRVPTSPGK